MEGEVRAQPGVQSWVAELPPDEREGYEQARIEDIEEKTEEIKRLLIEQFGEELLDPETLEETARKIATAIRDGLEQGIQLGLDAKEREVRPELNRLHSVEIMRGGGYG